MKVYKPTFKDKIQDSLITFGIIALIDLIALIPLFQAILSYLLMLAGMIIGFVLYLIISIPSLLFMTDDMPLPTDFMWGFPEPFTSWIVFVVLTVLILIGILVSIWNKPSASKCEQKSFKENKGSSIPEQPIHTIPENVLSRKELHEKRIRIDKQRKAELKRKVQEVKKQKFENLTPDEKKSLIAYFTNIKPDLKPGDLVRHKSKNLVLVVSKVDEHYITCRFLENNEDAGRFPIYMYDFPVYKYIND